MNKQRSIGWGLNGRFIGLPFVVRTVQPVLQLERAVVVGPIARMELIAADENKAGDNVKGPGSIIEAQIPAQQFRELGFKEGETLVVTPRRARVFVDEGANI